MFQCGRVVRFIMFVDRIKVFAQAGTGGRGSVSFRREKFVPKGGPDGGDGGRGGNVILRADRHVDNLANLFYEPLIKAKNGGHGMGKKMSGRAGADKIVKVPVGTVVWPAEEEKHATSTVQPPTSNSEQLPIGNRQSAIPVTDLARDGQEFVLCRAEEGGREMCISEARATARRANTQKAKKVNRDVSCWSCGPSPTRDWLGTRMLVNQPCYRKFRRRDRRSPPIHLRRFTRSSA